jgi:hypothetical protein
MPAPMLRIVRLGWRDRNAERSASAIKHESMDSTESVGSVMIGRMSLHSPEMRFMESMERVVMGELLSVSIVQGKKGEWRSADDAMTSVFSVVVLGDLVGPSRVSGRFVGSLRIDLENEGLPTTKPTILSIVIIGREMVDVL